MTAYHHSYPHYTGHDFSRRPPSHSGDLHGHIGHDSQTHGYFDRDPLYTQSTGRPDTRHDPTSYRNYTLPTPIHEPEPENGQKRRVTLACARCRKRKIKCSGDPGNGMGCQACRSSGVDVIHCTFDRVGTTHKYCIEPDSANSPTTSTTSYGATNYAGLPVEGSSRPLSYSQLDVYGFEVQNPPEPQFSDERIWATHRPSQSLYANLTPAPLYDTSYHAPMPRIVTNPETLAPLSMATLQSGLPLAVERRLPAPNLVGTSLPADLTSPTSSVSGKFASLSLRGSQFKGCMENNNHAPTGRQKPAQDLANASVMLPPVSHDYKAIASAQPDQTYLLSNSSTDDLYATCSATAVQSSYATSLSPIPSTLSSSSLNGPRYTPKPTSTPTISEMVTSQQLINRHHKAPHPQEYSRTTGDRLTDRRSSAASVPESDESGQPQRYQTIAIAPIISSSSCSQPQLARTTTSHSNHREKCRSRMDSVQYGPSGKL